jgi:hypothetical protein
MRPASLRPFLPRPALRRRIFISRNYAIQAPGAPTLQVFNRHTKYLQKERAATDVERSRQVDYLKDEVAIRLSERLLVPSPSPSWNWRANVDFMKGYKPALSLRPRPWSQCLPSRTSSHSTKSRHRSKPDRFPAVINTNWALDLRRILSNSIEQRHRPSLQL